MEWDRAISEIAKLKNQIDSFLKTSKETGENLTSETASAWVSDGSGDDLFLLKLKCNQLK